jgi:HEAT repeat protein
VDLKNIKVPDGVTAIGVEDLTRRLRDALRSDEAMVRGQSLVALGELGAPVRETVRHLASGLRDRDEYVRRCAASALAALGPRAASAAGELETALEAEKLEAARSQFQSAIEAVKAPPPATGDRARDEATDLEAIRRFVERARENRKG